MLVYFIHWEGQVAPFVSTFECPLDTAGKLVCIQFILCVNLSATASEFGMLNKRVFLLSNEWNAFVTIRTTIC